MQKDNKPSNEINKENLNENNQDYYFQNNNLKETLLERLHSYDHDDVYNEIYNHYAPEKSKEKGFFKKITENLKPGLTVGLVNLPLSISLAVASGTTPTAGILSGIIAGSITGFFGGSNYNIVGPTGALSGFLMSCVIRYGMGILPLFAILTGFFTFLTGYFKLEEFIDLVPVPVNEGFTFGVAFTIFFNQMNSALGIGKFQDAIPFHSKNINPSIFNNMTVNSTFANFTSQNSSLVLNLANEAYNMENLNSEIYQKVVSILESGSSESLVHNIIMNLNHINQMKWEAFTMYLAFFLVFLYLIIKHGKIPWMIISAILGILVSNFTTGRIDTLQSKFGILNFEFFNFGYLSDPRSNVLVRIFDIRTWIEVLPLHLLQFLRL